MKKLRLTGAVCLFLLIALPAAAQKADQSGGGSGTEAAGAAAAESGAEEQTAAGPETAENAGAPEAVNEEELAINDPDTSASQFDGGFTAYSWWDFLRMFLILGAVIAVIYGVFYVLKKSGNPKFQANNLISVLSTQNLQGNRSLHLVEVGNEVFLIGSAEGNVRLVSKIEDGETIDELRLYKSEMGAGGKSFQEALRGFFSRGEETEPSGDHVRSGAAFLHKQRERLKNL